MDTKLSRMTRQQVFFKIFQIGSMNFQRERGNEETNANEFELLLKIFNDNWVLFYQYFLPILHS
jgi:hypothetical protein